MVEIKVPIEVDVTYVNKTWHSSHKKKGGNAKHYVIGIFRRGIYNVPPVAIIKAIQDNKPETISEAVIESVVKGATLYAHENILPTSLKEYYEICELKVSDGQYVNGDIHINNVNNVWRDLKRNIKREHIQVSKKHLQLYCNEVAWRINHAHLSEKEKFEAAFKNISIPGGKTTYKNLIK